MNTKLVAQLNNDNRYIGVAIIQESPLEPGTWLYPENCVDLLPDESVDLNLYFADYDTTTGAYTYTEKQTVHERLYQLKSDKVSELIRTVDSIIGSYTYDYSEAEKLSWPKQEQEAFELLDDPDANAPLLRLLSASRGKDLNSLRDKILENVENYTFLSAMIIGLQQKYLDQIEAYTVDDIEELRDLKFTFPI